MKNTLGNFNVTDRKSCIEFIDLLCTDFINYPENWGNNTLTEFLEAIRYTEEIQGYYDNMNLNKHADFPDWSIFADIFKGAKIYE